MTFDIHIGIDYSGRATSTKRTPALQIYATRDSDGPQRIRPPAASEKACKNWCRAEIADWLIEQARTDIRFIAGIDHCFSFPISYFKRYKLSAWTEFLDDFARHWPTDQEEISVDAIRNGSPLRVGSTDEFRLTEKWTSSAKSVFLFDVQGSVAKSTHTGIPWLRRIRNEVGNQVHIWPL